MAETKRQEVDLLGETIEYEVRRSSKATKPRIDVDINGVTVVVPESETTSPAELLRDNGVWVVEKKERFDAYREDVPDRKYKEGERFPYLGKDHEVVIERRSSSAVGERRLRLAKHHVEETSVKRALETLYRRKARETFEERADHYAEKLDVEYQQIEVRNQRTKWGSCSTTGTLGLNWRLMMAPEEIVDYVVLHEIAHLREPNHDNSFWSLVAEYDSDYERHAEWLEKNSTRLVFSEDDL